MAVEPPTAASGPLLLADISGYTSFLQFVAAEHANDAFADGAVPDAYAVVSSLLNGIVERLVPPFTLAGLEGDAVFAFATSMDALPRGAALLDCIAECHADFRRRLGTAHDLWTCRCGACARIDDLDVKFIMHAGPFVLQQTSGRQQVAGPEVVKAHRLLKNGAAAVVGRGAYALITEEAVTRFDVPVETATAVVENHDHYQPIQAYVFPLQA